jgi:hypothetical protein
MSEPTKLESALDELLAGKSTAEIVGPEGLLKQLTKALIERAMKAEMSHHLGYEEHAPEGRGSGNSRNGKSRKTVQGDFGAVEIEVPRDRNGTFDPKIIPKHERRFTGFDEKILSMYARGMTTRDIQGHLEEMYRVEVSPALRCAVREDAARRASGKSGGIRRDRSHAGGRQGSIGTVDQRNRGSQAVAADTDGTAPSWGAGHPDRLRGWAKRIPGCDRRGVSANHGAAVHRAHGAEQFRIRELERAQSRGQGFTGDLPCDDGAGSRATLAGIRRDLGRQISAHREAVAAALGRHHPAVRVSRGDPPGDLHHEYH